MSSFTNKFTIFSNIKKTKDDYNVIQVLKNYANKLIYEEDKTGDQILFVFDESITISQK